MGAQLLRKVHHRTPHASVDALLGAAHTTWSVDRQTQVCIGTSEAADSQKGSAVNSISVMEGASLWSDFSMIGGQN